MPVALYMDVHIPRAITTGLRRLGVDVITAQEDNAATLSDRELLGRATALDRALFTFDDDLLIEGHARQAQGHEFAGVIYAHPLKISIGDCVQDLLLIATAGEPEDLKNQIIFLPFR